LRTRIGWALGLAAVGLLVRLPLLVGRNDADSSDTVFYLSLADDLFEGRGFDRAGMFYTPGYPLAFAVLRPLPGRVEDAMAVLQHLLGLGVIVVIVLAAWRYFGRVAALSAGTLAALTPLLATSEHLLLPDFLFGVLVLAGGLLLAEASTRAPSPPLLMLALAGICFGLATWIKPAGQFLLLAPPLALVFATRSPRATLLGSAVALLAMLLTISPWLYRNVEKYQAPTMSNQGGATLFKRVFETDRLPFPQDSPYAGLARGDQKKNGRVGWHRTFHNALVDDAGLTSEEALSKQTNLALTAIWRSPGDYALGTVRRTGQWIWNMNHVDDRHDLPPELRREGRAVPQQITTWTWSASTVLLIAWFIASLGGAASLALLFVGDERSRRAAGALVSVWLVVTLGTVLTHGGLWRYTMQLAPITFMLGSAGAVALARVTRSAV
jgi:4-amino-4-deoxy-L-arabinose transferase-like glycosyltransferase